LDRSAHIEILLDDLAGPLHLAPTIVRIGVGVG
jgi:hypothetical protein